tara:strand:+ start:496 stop:1080 length:585 start_codon:yes stop_codon:yes gene_type:complete
MIQLSKMTGKLERIPAYNTNTTSNEFCIRQKDTDTICGECYSHRMLSTYRKNCVPAFERNSEAFSKPIRWDDLPVLNHAFLRINGHGELINMTHLINCHAIALKNPHCNVVIWTKRAGLIRDYHKHYKQPKNLILIFSNPRIDKPIPVPRGFDKVFNNVQSDNTPQNCTGKKCIECLACYRKDSGTDIIVEAVK